MVANLRRDVLVDARHKTFKELAAQRALSQGLREILGRITVEKVAIVREEDDYALDAISASEPRLRWFKNIEPAYAWLSGGVGTG